MDGFLGIFQPPEKFLAGGEVCRRKVSMSAYASIPLANLGVPWKAGYHPRTPNHPSESDRRILCRWPPKTVMW